jgi:hypothetical protein
MDKKRMVSDVELPLVAAPGRCELRRIPLASVRRELPGIRAEIRERSIARELNVPAGNGVPEESPASNLVHVGNEVYEIRPVEGDGAPAVPVETGPAVGQEPVERPAVTEPEQAPSDLSPVPAMPEPSPPSPEPPAAPAVRTVTLADLYWSQGEESTARRIVGEILHDDPANLRAQAWLAARAGDDLAEAELLGFLETMAKEYGYDLS